MQLSLSALDQHYLPHLAETRARLRDDPGLRAVFDGPFDGAQLIGFALEFCSLGARLFEDMERRIERAGHACIHAGREGLGADIVVRARSRSGRGPRLLDDAFELARVGREVFGLDVDIDALTRQPPPNAVLRALELHESIATGPHPWAELGVELELRTMAAHIAPPLLARCRALLEPSAVRAFGFVHAYPRLGPNDLEASAERLETLLGREPDLGWPIAERSEQILSAHLDLFVACAELGLELVADQGARAA